eukprot:TRINITY_DN3607_c0_g1_i1.p1 TRINITY_DN3607_c0_g1~~TRINITY_DN3607_c0_g1_i1.p1  ORF type:complete len:291 (+),score=40.47 TRINITY_DN3607_c0_g1_i1:230-1102(+)
MEEDVGEGSTSVVYLATDLRKNLKVAIKSSSYKDEMLLASELHLLKISNHQNIVQLYDIFLVGEKIWIVMEYMNGGCLADLIEYHNKHPLLEPHIKYITSNVLFGLNYLHNSQRLHRNITPQNILLNMEGNVKIADFSYAAQLTPEKKKRKTLSGSGYRMAPEMLASKKYDQKVDVWGVGILIMEMCDGTVPYTDIPEVKAMDIIRQKGAPKLKRPENWSKGLHDFLQLCLKKKPEKRGSSKDLLVHPWIQSTLPMFRSKHLITLIEAIKKERSEAVENFKLSLLQNLNS